MWYDHQILRLRDTFAKKSKAWQKCASFSRFTDLCGKKSKNKKCSIHQGIKLTFVFDVGANQDPSSICPNKR